MSDALPKLDVKQKNIPEGISFIRVNSKTGKIDDSRDSNTYFELLLDENIRN